MGQSGSTLKGVLDYAERYRPRLILLELLASLLIFLFCICCIDILFIDFLYISYISLIYLIVIYIIYAIYFVSLYYKTPVRNVWAIQKSNSCGFRQA